MITFDVVLHDDEETQEKIQFLSRLETALDHSKNLNEIPDEFLEFTDSIPIGSKVRITVEIV